MCWLDKENRLMDIEGLVELGGEEGGTDGESSMETYSAICRIASHGNLLYDL